MFQLTYRDATLDDIIKLLNATGFLHDVSEFKFAREWDLFKFIGVSGGSIRYMIGFDDGPKEGDMYASILHVNVSNSECGFTCDWTGCPVFETRDLDALTKYFETRCN